MTKSTKLLSISTQFKNISIFALMSIALVAYFANIKIAFFFLTVYAIAKYFPMPPIFNTWFSRTILSTLVLYSLLQIASVAQIYIAPDSNFIFTACFTALSIVALIKLLVMKPIEKIRPIDIKDTFVLMGSIIFIIPFLPIITGDNSIARITEIASIQVTDAIAHTSSVADFSNTQSLADYYQKGKYYPSGFHIATSFIQDNLIGNINQKTWSFAVAIYFMQYLVLGFLFTSIIIYFCLNMSQRFGLNKDRTILFAQTITVGAVLTITHTLLFFNDGFLNYYYISAALIAALTYILTDTITFDSRKKIDINIKNYLQPVILFLLLGFGASMSWPLLAPVFVLTVCLIFLSQPTLFKLSKQHLYIYTIIASIILLHILVVLFQSMYMNNGNLINLPGALSNFNGLFVLIGVVSLLYIVKNRVDYKAVLMYLALPLISLVTGLLIFQLFTVGAPIYYTIKVSLLFEILSIIFVVISLLIFLRSVNATSLQVLITLPIVTLSLVMCSYASVNAPFQELRGLFREYSGQGKPAYMDRDIYLLAELGKKDEIFNYNITSLHYNSESGKLYSHIQPVAWAQSLLIDGTIHDQSISERNSSCFGRQFRSLTYEPYSDKQQSILKQAIKECIEVSKKNGVEYVIITDKDSYTYIRSIYGDELRIVY